MSNSKLVYETGHARAWLADPASGVDWEYRVKHRHSGDFVWESVQVHIYSLGVIAPDSPLASHRATQPAGTREVWVVSGETHLKDDYELVVERWVASQPGGLFWRWRLYTRTVNRLPGADFQYEDRDGSDSRDHGYAALHVLTHPPDMVVTPGGAR